MMPLFFFINLLFLAKKKNKLHALDATVNKPSPRRGARSLACIFSLRLWVGSCAKTICIWQIIMGRNLIRLA